MAYLPPVKLETHTSWFDILLTVLHEHAESDPYEEYREMAQRLIQHFMTHGRSFTDGYQKKCVNLRMYPNEAADTIWLLLLSLSGHYSADKNYHADLQPYRNNNE